MTKEIPKKPFLLLLSLLLLSHFVGLFNDVFTADSAVYATISKSFVTTGDYLNIYLIGDDWLDKPHFPFWVCAFFMKIFGLTAFAYKLPSFLFFCMGLYYTFLLAKKLYDKATAQYAVLIVASSIQLIISNNDVRAEAILLGLIMAGIYYMYLLSVKMTFKSLILAAVFTGAAIMTKGMFVLIIFYGGVFGHYLFSGEWKKLLHFKWVLLLLLTGICITPELYAVYTQFDLHPEKVVFGETNVSGVRFFFWDSQFGRFFNTGPIKGKGDPSYFIHTSLWAFAPWAVLGFIAVIKSGISIFKKQEKSELVNFFAYALMFVVFSMSSFQLSHYTNIIFPFAGILVARLLTDTDISERMNKIGSISVHVYFIAFLLLIPLIEWFFQPSFLILGILTVAGLLIALWFVHKKIVESKNYKTLVLGCIVAAGVGFYLNISFYPDLLTYQSGSKAARFVNANYPDHEVVLTKKDWPLEFYLNKEVLRNNKPEEINKYASRENLFVFAGQRFADQMLEEGVSFDIIETFDQFHITKINGKFFNHKTRKEAMEPHYLLQLKK